MAIPGRIMDPERIPEVKLTKSREAICRKIMRICLRFFDKGCNPALTPFRGILLSGPPGSGKTEIAKQVARILGIRFKRGPYKIRLVFVDSADIASPKWGDAEAKLRAIFNCEEASTKTIILFDDIDCLMLERGSHLSKEWHYSINSVIFHELDRLNPANTMVIATTNRPDLVDKALKSRLYEIEVPIPPKEELLEIAKEMARSMIDSEAEIERIISIVKKRLETESLDIRDIQHIVLVECIERGYG